MRFCDPVPPTEPVETTSPARSRIFFRRPELTNPAHFAMLPTLAKAYIVLSGFILIVVGVAGFFRHEMFDLTFPFAHNLFHLLSGVLALLASLGRSPGGPRRFGLIFGAIYILVAVAGFAGLQDLRAMALGLNLRFNFIHLGIGLLSLLAGLALPRERDGQKSDG